MCLEGSLDSSMILQTIKPISRWMHLRVQTKLQFGSARPELSMHAHLNDLSSSFSECW